MIRYSVPEEERKPGRTSLYVHKHTYARTHARTQAHIRTHKLFKDTNRSKCLPLPAGSFTPVGLHYYCCYMLVIFCVNVANSQIILVFFDFTHKIGLLLGRKFVVS